MPFHPFSSSSRQQPVARRHRWPIVVAVLFIAAGFAVARPVAAAETFNNFLIQVVGGIVQIFVNFLGQILIKVIDMIVGVAQYNSFGSALVVEKGWIVVRDLSNMFFIVILLVIAFGTVLKWESYRYNRLLGRLILMAVLINFSKFITLFFIDVSQVIMLTFVHAFANAAAGNLTTGFGVSKMLELVSTGGGEVTLLSAILALILAVVLLIIAVVVSLIILLMLVQRIIAFWLLVVFSPISFLAAALPPGKLRQFHSSWWEQFGKYWMTGPLLAFFLWLAMITIQITSSNNEQIIPLNTSQQTLSGSLGVGNETLDANAGVAFAASQISTTENLFNYIVTIGILMAAIASAQKLGGVAGQFAGAASSKIQQVGTRIAKRAAIIGGIATVGGGIGVAGSGVLGAAPAVALKTAGLGLGYFGARRGLPALGRKVEEKGIRPLTRYPFRAAAGVLGAVPGLGRTRWVQGIRRLGETGAPLRPSYWKEAYKSYSAQRSKQKAEEPRGGLQDVFHRFISNQRTDYARQARRRLQREEQAKIDTEDSSEIQRIVEGGIVSKNFDQVAGGNRKLAITRNLNDEFKNKGYEVNREGFFKYVDEQLIKRAGASRQKADELGKDLSYMAEGAGMWGLSRMYYDDPVTGETRRVTSDEEWARIVANQQSKQEAQLQMRNNHWTSYATEMAIGVTKDGRLVDPTHPEAVEKRSIDTGRLHAAGREIIPGLVPRHADRMPSNVAGIFVLNHSEDENKLNPELYAKNFATIASLPDDSKLRLRDVLPRVYERHADGTWEEDIKPVVEPDYNYFTDDDKKKLKSFLKSRFGYSDGDLKEDQDFIAALKEEFDEIVKPLQLNEFDTRAALRATPPPGGAPTGGSAAGAPPPTSGGPPTGGAPSGAGPAGPPPGGPSAGGGATGPTAGPSSPPTPPPAGGGNAPQPLSVEESEQLVRRPDVTTPEQQRVLNEVYTNPEMSTLGSEVADVHRQVGEAPEQIARNEFEALMSRVTENLSAFQDALDHATESLGQHQFGDVMIRSIIEPLKTKIEGTRLSGAFRSKEEQQSLIFEMRRVYEILGRQYEEARKRGAAGPSPPEPIT